MQSLMISAMRYYEEKEEEWRGAGGIEQERRYSKRIRSRRPKLNWTPNEMGKMIPTVRRDSGRSVKRRYSWQNKVNARRGG